MRSHATLGMKYLASLWGVTPLTIRNWMDKGKIPFVVTPCGRRRVLRLPLLKMLKENPDYHFVLERLINDSRLPGSGSPNYNIARFIRGEQDRIAAEPNSHKRRALRKRLDEGDDPTI